MSRSESSTEANITSEIVRRWRGELRVHCYRMLGSLADADDATQEALLRAHRSAAAVVDPKATRAWLYKIATNVCLDRLGRRPMQPHLDPCPAPFWEPGEPGPEARVSARESIALAFLAALSELSPPQRAVTPLRRGHAGLALSSRREQRARAHVAMAGARRIDADVEATRRILPGVRNMASWLREKRARGGGPA